MTKLTVAVESLLKNNWKHFAKRMDQLGRLTDVEIEPKTWRRALLQAGVQPGGDLSALASKAAGLPYLLMSFEVTPDLKSVDQRITFSGTDEPIKFRI